MSAIFTANRRELLSAVRNASQIVPKRSPNPKLGTMRLGVNGTVELSANNREVSIETHFNWDRDGEQSVNVSPWPIIKALTALKCSRVEVMIQESAIVVTGDGATVAVPYDESDSEEYPAIGRVVVAPADTICSGAFVAAELVNAIKQTEYCTDPESTRYALGGVCLVIADGKGTFVATDSRRLSRIILDCGNCTGTFTGVLPLSAILSVSKLATAGLVQVDCSENQVTFSGEGWSLVTRLVEGRFPRYQDVIPRSHCYSATLDRARLTAAIKAGKQMCDEESRGADFRFADGTLSMRFGKDDGLAIQRVPYDGTGLDVITFDPRFILEYVEALPKSVKVVTLGTSHCDHAATLTAGPSDAVCVIMPLSRQR